jgi:hypothetical protein
LHDESVYQAAKAVNPDDAGLSERVTTILKWADTFALSPAELTDEVKQAMLDQFPQETILECMVYTLIGLNMSKMMIALGVEVGAEGTTPGTPERDVQPYVNSVDEAWVAAKESWEALTSETAKLGEARRAQAKG